MQPSDGLQRVSEVGEFGLIKRLSQTLGVPSHPNLLIGIGDDAAAWRPSPESLTVATTDALVEGVHFNVTTTNWEDLGWKALAENISDIAAMGCQPRYALVTLSLPPHQALGDLDQLYVGMRSCGARFGCSVVGGDVVSAGAITINVTVVGESLKAESDADRPLLERSTAKAGDLIAVTGPLGGSAGGLRLLLGWADPSLDPIAADRLRNAHRRPTPRVDVGLTLVEEGLRCGIDVSDGLVADVGHICERSVLDAEISASTVPLYPGLERIFPGQALKLALTGGEDYELVCAGPAAAIERVNERLAARKLGSLIVIGCFVPTKGTPSVRVRGTDGGALDLEDTGWDHFARG